MNYINDKDEISVLLFNNFQLYFCYNAEISVLAICCQFLIKSILNLVLFGEGHIQQYLWLTSGSVFRDHARQSSSDNVVF